MKPWTRWWWEGSAVNKKDITWNLQQYQQAGLGGMELTPIYGVYGFENSFVDFLSPKWMDLFSYTLKESKRLGLGLDLANGTGWPFGGPWVSDQDASKSVYFKTYQLKGGEQLKEMLAYQREALVRTANNKTVAVDTLSQPVSRNKNLQALALDQIQYPGKIPLTALVAYSDKNEMVDLALSNVDGNGKLNWTAPAGNWTIYALFEGLHGKMVERAAPGGEGYAIDHFSKAAANNYFKKFDAAFKGYDISYLRSFFNDSYEVDDARGQANWTPGFLDEFQKRKGYDLKKYLPALFGKDKAEINSRVIYDYRSLIDELLLENFTMTWKKWALGKGKILRNQSHGSPANTLDLYSVVDIPETEGTDILRFKFASSAGNVSGKKLVSSESATWLNEHFLSSWADVKKAIDLYFLGGVNHIFYHGTEYSPKEAPWPGWLFYAAVHFQPTNPQWKDFSTLNNYITRVQSFLQQGKPDNDILVYYPIIDRYSEPGTALLQHFDGMERNFEKTGFEESSKWMLEHGYAFDFFSDRQVQQFKIEGDKINSSGNKYQTILLPANKLIDERSFDKIMQLAKAGAKILVYKDLPREVPGMSKLEVRQKKLNELIAVLNFKTVDGVQQASIGKGKFYLSEDLRSLLKSADIRRDYFFEYGLSSIRRINKDGQVYFITNRTNEFISEWVKVPVDAAEYALFNPMTGKKGLATIQKDQEGGFGIKLELNPFESLILQTFDNSIKADPYKFYNRSSFPHYITGKWKLDFIGGGPTLPASTTLDQLVSWTELPNEEAKYFSGTVRYTIQFKKPEGGNSAKAWLLDLGKVHETAEVFLNGKKLSTLIGPVYQVNVPASSLLAENKLEIVVANLMANRIIWMDKNNKPWKIFYNTNMPARKRENVKDGLFSAADWKPLPSGLLGSVSLTALE